MSTTYHTAIVNGASNDASTVNNPLGQLDAALGTLNTKVAVSLDTDGTLKAGAVDNSAALASNVVTYAKMAATLECVNLIPRYMSSSKHAWRNIAGTVMERWHDSDFPDGALYLPAGESIIYYLPIGMVGDIGDSIYLECSYKAVSGGTLVLAITQRGYSHSSVSNVFTNNTSTTRATAGTSATLTSGCVYMALTLTASTQAITVNSIRFGKNGNNRSTWVDDPKSPDTAKYLPATAAKLRSKQNISIMFRGTSITAGAVLGGSHTDSWTAQLCTYLGTNFGVTVTEINKGASSCDQWYDAAWNRVNNGFVAPDLVMIEVSHNNPQDPATDEMYLRCLDGQIQQTMQMYPTADIVLTVMNPHMTSADADANVYKMAAARMFGQRYGFYVIDAMDQIIKLYATGFDITLISEGSGGGTHHHPNLYGNDFIEFVARLAFRFGSSASGAAQVRNGAALGGKSSAYKYMRFFEADETDFFTYTGSWANVAYTIDGALEPNTIYYTYTTSDQVEFSWWGYGYYLLPDKASFCGISDITTDGTTEQHDHYDTGSRAVTKYSTYRKEDLTLGWHTVTLANTGTKNASSTDDEVGLAGAYIAAVPGYIVDDEASPVTYTGANWVQQINAAAYGGTYQQNVGTDTAQYVELDFIGTGVVGIFRTSANSGIVSISVDGISTGATLDTYSSSTIYAQRLSVIDNLPYGRHTLRLTNTNTKNASSTAYGINIDGFMVTDNRCVPGQTVRGVAGQGDTVEMVAYFTNKQTPEVMLTSEGTGTMYLSAKPAYNGFTIAGTSGAKGVFEVK